MRVVALLAALLILVPRVAVADATVLGTPYDAQHLSISVVRNDDGARSVRATFKDALGDRHPVKLSAGQWANLVDLIATARSWSPPSPTQQTTMYVGNVQGIAVSSTFLPGQGSSAILQHGTTSAVIGTDTFYGPAVARVNSMLKGDL